VFGLARRGYAVVTLVQEQVQVHVLVHATNWASFSSAGSICRASMSSSITITVLNLLRGFIQVGQRAQSALVHCTSSMH
jgi:hypothetical protein